MSSAPLTLNDDHEPCRRWPPLPQDMLGRKATVYPAPASGSLSRISIICLGRVRWWAHPEMEIPGHGSGQRDWPTRCLSLTNCPIFSCFRAQPTVAMTPRSFLLPSDPCAPAIKSVVFLTLHIGREGCLRRYPIFFLVSSGCHSSIPAYEA